MVICWGFNVLVFGPFIACDLCAVLHFLFRDINMFLLVYQKKKKKSFFSPLSSFKKKIMKMVNT